MLCDNIVCKENLKCTRPLDCQMFTKVRLQYMGYTVMDNSTESHERGKWLGLVFDLMNPIWMRTWDKLNKWSDETFGPLTAISLHTYIKSKLHDDITAQDAVDMVIMLSRVPGFAENFKDRVGEHIDRHLKRKSSTPDE